MMTTNSGDSVKWTLGSGDVKIEVTATMGSDGSITFKYDLVSGVADLNGIFFDFGNDGGTVNSIGSKSNNMNGSDADGDKLDGFDYAKALGSVGGNDADHVGGTVVFTKEQLEKFGVKGLADLAPGPDGTGGLEIGFRATSVGDDRADSLKLAGTGVFCPGDNGQKNHFPELDKDISNVVFYFKADNLDANMTGDANGDGFFTVKIDTPNEAFDDLDKWFQKALDAIIFQTAANTSTTLLGVHIKSGNQAFGDLPPPVFGAKNDIAFFALDNNIDNDPLPLGLSSPITDNDIDVTIAYQNAWHTI